MHTRTLDYRLQRIYELTGLQPAAVIAADERLVLATSACPTTSPPRRD